MAHKQDTARIQGLLASSESACLGCMQEGHKAEGHGFHQGHTQAAQHRVFPMTPSWARGQVLAVTFPNQASLWDSAHMWAQPV